MEGNGSGEMEQTAGFSTKENVNVSDFKHLVVLAVARKPKAEVNKGRS